MMLLKRRRTTPGQCPKPPPCRLVHCDRPASVNRSHHRKSHPEPTHRAAWATFALRRRAYLDRRDGTRPAWRISGIAFGSLAFTIGIGSPHGGHHFRAALCVPMSGRPGKDAFAMPPVAQPGRATWPSNLAEQSGRATVSSGSAKMCRQTRATDRRIVRRPVWSLHLQKKRI